MEIIQHNKNILISKITEFDIERNELGFFHNPINIKYWVEKNTFNENLLVWKIDNDDRWRYEWDYRKMIAKFGFDIKKLIKNFLIEMYLEQNKK